MSVCRGGKELIGQRIKELRKKVKMTQQELAEGIITRSYLSQIEKGTIQPSYEVLQQLATKLDCDIERFYETPVNKNLMITEYKREIKSAENLIIIKDYNKVERILEKITNKNIEGLNNYDYGILRWVEGKFNKHIGNMELAIEKINESIDFLKTTHSVEQIIRSMNSLGSIYLSMNKEESALEILNEAYILTIHEQITGAVKVSFLVNLGITHGKLKEYYSAIKFLNEAKYMNQAMGFHLKEGHIYMALGVCNMQLKRLDESQECYLSSIDVFRMTKDKENEAGAFTNLGILYSLLDNYEDSKKNLIKAIDIYSAIKTSSYNLLNAKSELAKTFFFLKDNKKASQYCYEILTSKHQRLRLYAYKLLGDIFFEEKSIEDTINNYSEALGICEREDYKEDYRDISEIIGCFYYEIGEYKLSAEYYKKSGRLVNRQSKSSSLSF